jgi:hypothetical protein
MEQQIEVLEKGVAKALEVWGLQSMLDISILLGIVALGLALAQDYYRALEKHLSLRVSIEWWRVLTVAVVDILLTVVVVIGYLVLNPDIMADIKVAVPFCPIATVLFAIALVVRLFCGGHKPGTPSNLASLYTMLAANAINIVGFTFIMEAASGEYLENHPSAGWKFIKEHFRSNADPAGLELTQITFYIAFPVLMAVLVWGAVLAIKQLSNSKAE